MTNPTLQLWTVQPLWVYETLQERGVFYPRPLQDPESWLHSERGEAFNAARFAYEWLNQEMVRRGVAKPEGAPEDAFPVWAWYWWAGQSRPKPDLRNQSLKSWAKSTRHVLLELAVPAQDVLLHDYNSWHAALNYWYLAEEPELDHFEARCKEQGWSVYRNKPLPDAAWHQEVLRSWERIFELDHAVHHDGQALDVSRATQVVQATFWALRAEQVKTVKAFGAGQPAQRLA